MILGLFYHVGLIYGVNNDWRVYSEENNYLISVISDFIHLFRMEAFYLISGFFFMLVYNKNRPLFLLDRVCRALVPLLFCGLVINLVMNYYSYNRTYNLNSYEYFIDGEWLGHLWFLGNLIVYFLFTTFLSRHILATSSLTRSMLLLLLLVITPVLSMLGIFVSKIIYSEILVFITFSNLFYFYFYFVAGCFCFKNKEVFLDVLNVRTFFTSISLFILLFFTTHLDIMTGMTLVKLINHLSAGSLMLAMMSLIYSIGNSNSKIIRNFSGSSYTIYILHQPLIVLFSVFLFEKIYLPGFIEYALLICLVFFVSYNFHIHLVKENRVLKLLFNGVLPLKKVQHAKPGSKM